MFYSLHTGNETWENRNILTHIKALQHCAFQIYKFVLWVPLTSLVLFFLTWEFSGHILRSSRLDSEHMNDVSSVLGISQALGVFKTFTPHVGREVHFAAGKGVSWQDRIKLSLSNNM